MQNDDQDIHNIIENMNVIAQDNAFSQGIHYAFRCLNQRDYSVGELREKLVERNYPTEAIEQIIHRLEQLSYIDDERYAQIIVRKYQAKYGKRRIQSILKSKYISAEISDSVLDDMNVESEVNTAQAIVEKELRKSKNTILSQQDSYRISQKLVKKLISQGLELNVAYDVVRSALAADCSDI